MIIYIDIHLLERKIKYNRYMISISDRKNYLFDIKFFNGTYKGSLVYANILLKNIKKEYKFKAREKAKSNIKVKGLCENCNINLAVDRHHKDYNKPLEVILLCKKCHRAIHEL